MKHHNFINKNEFFFFGRIGILYQFITSSKAESLTIICYLPLSVSSNLKLSRALNIFYSFILLITNFIFFINNWNFTWSNWRFIHWAIPWLILNKLFISWDNDLLGYGVIQFVCLWFRTITNEAKLHTLSYNFCLFSFGMCAYATHPNTLKCSTVHLCIAHASRGILWQIAFFGQLFIKYTVVDTTSP